MASAKKLSKFYSHNVQIYLEIPTETLTRLEIEELALERLNLFKLIESSYKRGYKTYSNEWIEDITVNLRKNYKNTFYKLCEQSTVLCDPPESELNMRKMDYCSHYVLRTGYSTLKDLQLWFIERETEWLYVRYQIQSIDSKQLFLFLNGIEYTKISDKEKEQILQNLCEGQDTEEAYYKVDFKEAINLIKDRKVYVKGGYAYVSFGDLIWCIMVRYNLYLQKVLLQTCQNSCLLARNYIDLVQLIKRIINQGNTPKYVSTASSNLNDEADGNSNREITISELKKCSRDSFPLCMKSLYDELKEVHHLKYGERIQLGKFIKSTGLSLNDALNFWAGEFTHKMTATHFEKNYSYYIKHMYGQVGRRKEYLPDKCTDIVKHSLGVGETHGCPFKILDTLNLTQTLKRFKISQRNIDEIVNDVAKQQYQKACCTYFKAIHSVSQDIAIHAPLQYFDQSRVILKQRKKPHEIVSDDSEDDKM